MTCPSCGKAALVFREADSVETHGLECGPYEHFHDEWWECPECRGWFTDRELEALL